MARVARLDSADSVIQCGQLWNCLPGHGSTNFAQHLNLSCSHLDPLLLSLKLCVVFRARVFLLSVSPLLLSLNCVWFFRARVFLLSVSHLKDLSGPVF